MILLKSYVFKGYNLIFLNDSRSKNEIYEILDKLIIQQVQIDSTSIFVTGLKIIRNNIISLTGYNLLKEVSNETGNKYIINLISKYLNSNLFEFIRKKLPCVICNDSEISNFECEYFVQNTFSKSKKYINPEEFLQIESYNLNSFVKSMSSQSYPAVVNIELIDKGKNIKWDENSIDNNNGKLFDYNNLPEDVKENWLSLAILDEDELDDMKFIQVLSLKGDDSCSVDGYFPVNYYEKDLKCPWTMRPLPIIKDYCDAYNGSLKIHKLNIDDENTFDKHIKHKTWYSLEFTLHNTDENIYNVKKFAQIPIYEDDIRSEVMLYYMIKAFKDCKLFLLGESISNQIKTITHSSIHLKSIRDIHIYENIFDDGHGYELGEVIPPYYDSFLKTFTNFLLEAYKLNVLDFGFVIKYIMNYDVPIIERMINEVYI